MAYGKFITLEGCEGVGKSTQLKLLKDALDARGIDSVFTREPGGSVLAEKIRTLIITEEMDALTEAMLFAAARVEHVNQVILPALKEGKFVVSDRFVDSSVAYQGYARKLGEDFVKELNAYAYRTCLPDATVFIDMNPADSWRKRKGTVVEGDRLEAESAEFHSAVYRGFKTLAEKDDRIVSVVPGADKTETAAKILAALKEKGIF